MRIKIYSLGIVICLILSSFVVLSSCNTLLDEPVGIDNAEINENGELVIFYSNGETKNVGVVVGEKGADGKDGVDGADGNSSQIIVTKTGKETVFEPKKEGFNIQY